MSFDEFTKKKVREMANFTCCRCKFIGVEVHHIVPENEGGTNDMDNAAPLCPNCHTFLGDNPQLRKMIKEMRDKHYKDCKSKKFDEEILERISDSMIVIQENQRENFSNQNEKLEKIAFALDYISKVFAERFDEIKNKAEEGIYPDLDSFAGDILRASGTASAVFENIGGKRTCPKCGKEIESGNISFATDKITCPNCNTLIFLSQYRV
jgi:hypothetical protein